MHKIRVVAFIVFILPLLSLACLLFNPASAFAADNFFKDNVAIGKTGATAKLDIVSSGSGMGFALRLANTAGTDQLAVLDNGNVGIGTTAPRQKLDVNGTALVSSLQVGTAATSGFVLTTNASGVGTWQAVSGTLPSGSAGQTLRHDGSNWAANYQLYNNGTNVGMGTTAPTARLDIFGSATAALGDALRITTESIQAFQARDTAGNVWLNVDTWNGRVGIGATDAPYLFQVQGAPTSASDLVKFRNADVNGYTTIGYFASDNTYKGAVGYANASTAAALASKFVISSGVGTDMLFLTDDNDDNINFIPRVIIKAVSGNVGIGTTNPRQRLDVNGTALVSTLQVGTSATSGFVLTADASGVGTWQSLVGVGVTGVAAGGLHQLQRNYPLGTLAGTPLMVYDDTANSVAIGVGTTNNLSRLYIKGIGTTLGFALRIADSTPTDRLVVLDNGNVGMGTTLPLGWLQVGTSPAPALLVTGRSNVGIGTTAARQRLDVNGTALVSSLQVGTTATAGNVLTADASGVATWQTVSGTVPSGSAGQTLRYSGANWVANSLIYNNGTNVGIGITNPVQRLSVNGTMRTGSVAIIPTADDGSSVLYFNAYYGTADTYINNGSAFEIWHENSTNNILHFQGAAPGTAGGVITYVDILDLRPDGNVGIGVPLPLARLDIKAFDTATGFALRLADYNSIDKVVVLDNGNVGIGNIQPRGLLQVGTAPTAPALLVTTYNNVGIGTSVPRQRLEVKGTALVSTLQVGTIATAGNVLTADASGVATWQTVSGTVSSGSAGQTLRHNGTNWVANNLIYNNGTNIGIGNTSPMGLLHVGTSPNSGLVVSTSGWVGIGTTNPGNLLYLKGANGYTVLTMESPMGANNEIAIEFKKTGSNPWTFGRSTFSNVNGDAMNIFENDDPNLIRFALIPGGNIGIGTTGPRQRLDVNGTALVSTLQVGTSATAGNVLTADASGVATWQAAASSGSGWNDDGTTVRLITTSDNVGIGVSGILAAKLSIQGAGTSSGFALRIADSAGTDRLVVFDKGNIGIGTTMPNALFAIKSPGANTDYMHFINPGDTNLAGTISYNSGSATNGGIGIWGARYINNGVGLLLEAEAPSGGSSGLMAAVSINGYENGGGNWSNISPVLTVTNNTAPIFTILGNGNVGMGTTLPLGWLQVGTSPAPALMVSRLSNVGIGTTNPRQKIDVNGTALVASLQVGTSATAGNVLTADASGVGTWQAPSGALPSGSTGQTLRYSGAAWVANSVLYNNGTNIGIGITNPTDVLHIVRDMDGDANLTIQNPNSGLNAYAQVQARNDAGNNAILGIGSSAATIAGLANRAFVWGSVNSDGVSLVSESSSGDIRFYINGADNPSERMRIEYDGNVGIGMTAPYARLDIKGKGMALGYALRIANSAAADKLVVLDNGNVGMGTTRPLGWLQVGSSPGPALLVSGLSNVGIGTTNPRQKLDVNGTALVSTLQVGTSATAGNILTADASGVATWQAPSGGGGWVDDGVTVRLSTLTDNVGIGVSGTLAGKLTIRGAGTNIGLALRIADSAGRDRLVVLDNGNVGIGTTAPDGFSPIHIKGDVANDIRLTIENTNSTGNAFSAFSVINDAGHMAQFEVGGTSASVFDRFRDRAIMWADSAMQGILIAADAPAGNILFQTSQKDRLYIEDDGSVGIGFTLPIARLDIRAAGTTLGFALRIADSAALDKLVVLDNGNVGITTTRPLGWLQVGTSPAPALLVTGRSNVGIGTTAARQRLDVNGTALVSSLQVGTSATSGFVLTSDASGVGTWQVNAGVLPSGSAGQTLRHNGAAWVANSLIYNNGTNVGIGTTDATWSKLTVAQDAGASCESLLMVVDQTGSDLFKVNDLGLVWASNYFQVGSTTLGQGGMSRFSYDDTNICIDNEAPTAGIDFYTGGSASVRMFIAANGNVGIGNFGIGASAPQAQLDIRGGGTTLGFALKISDSLSNPKLVVLDNGNVGIGTTAPRQKLEVNGTALVSTLQVGTSATAGQVLTADASGVATWQAASGGGGWVDDGVTVRLSTLTDNVGIGVSGTLAAKLDIRGAGTSRGFALRIADSAGTDKLVVLDNGNLGIGTTNPTSRLFIYNTSPGPVLFIQNDSDSDDIYIRSNIWPSIQLEDTLGNVSWEIGAGDVDDNDFTIMGGTPATARISIQRYGNVGIGRKSNTVNARLDVLGKGTGTGFAFRVADSAVTDRLVVLDNGYVGIATTRPLGLLQVGTSPFPGLFVKSTGMVGIGMTNPTSPLFVHSDADIDDVYIQSTNFPNIMFEDVNSSNAYSMGMGYIKNDDFAMIGGVPEIVRFYIDKNGNIGIGSTRPLAKLEIQSNGVSTVFAQRISDSAGTNRFVVLDNGNVGMGTTQPLGWLQVGTSPAPALLITGTGNVGIGTTAVANTFGVVGGAFITMGVTDTDSSSRVHHVISALSPNMPANNFTNIEIGETRSGNYNLGYIGFHYLALGSTSNYTTFGVSGADELLNIIGNGNVGVGTTAPGRTFFVQGEIGMSAAGGSKSVYDVAEIVPVSGELNEGDILVLRPNTAREAIRSYCPNDPLVIGVVSSESEEARSRGVLFIGDKDIAERATGRKHAYMSVAGQVEVKVCLENGEIKVGDCLTTSSQPGTGMKATQNTGIIGKAMEPFDGLKDGRQTGKIIMLLAPVYSAEDNRPYMKQLQDELEALRSKVDTLTERVKTVEEEGKRK